LYCYESQPCFTTEQVELLIDKAEGEARLAFAIMAYAGLRIGEVEQLRWLDIVTKDNVHAMIHVRRGGSNGTTKDRDERFVPVHPRIGELLKAHKKTDGLIFRGITERKLLARLKELCAECEFDDPTQYKLHSFRHHFASMCANHQVAHRKTLAWLGHSSSEMLDLYYHLHDEDSQQTMMDLARSTSLSEENSPIEGNLRAAAESKTVEIAQVPEMQELIDCISQTSKKTERTGFEPAVETSPTQPFQGCSISRSDTSPKLFVFKHLRNSYLLEDSFNPVDSKINSKILLLRQA